MWALVSARKELGGGVGFGRTVWCKMKRSPSLFFCLEDSNIVFLFHRICYTSTHSTRQNFVTDKAHTRGTPRGQHHKTGERSIRLDRDWCRVLLGTVAGLFEAGVGGLWF